MRPIRSAFWANVPLNLKSSGRPDSRFSSPIVKPRILFRVVDPTPPLRSRRRDGGAGEIPGGADQVEVRRPVGGHIPHARVLRRIERQQLEELVAGALPSHRQQHVSLALVDGEAGEGLPDGDDA